MVYNFEEMLLQSYERYSDFDSDDNFCWSFWNVHYVSTIPNFGDFRQFSRAFLKYF